MAMGKMTKIKTADSVHNHTRMYASIIKASGIGKTRNKMK